MGRLARRPGAALAVALVLRLAFCGAAEWRLRATGEEYLVPGDAAGYVDLADDIVSRWGKNGYWTGPLARPWKERVPLYLGNFAVNGEVHPRKAMRPPVFPLILAGPVRWDQGGRPPLLPWDDPNTSWDDRRPSPHNHTAARLTVALCGTLCVWATGRLGTTIGGPAIGAAAAWLAALNPLAIAFSGMLLSESAFALLITISLWGVAECVRRDPLTGEPPRRLRWGPAVWGGLAAAGATLTRPVWLPFVPCVALLALLLAWRGRGSAWWAVILLLAFANGMTPWAVRNWVVLGEPILTTTWGGPTLYDSLGPQATGASDMRFRDAISKMPGYDEFEGLEFWPEPDRGAIPPELRPGYHLEYSDGGPLPEWPGDGPEDRPAVRQIAWVQTWGYHRWLTDDERVKAAVDGDELASDRLYRRAALDAAWADPPRVARLAVVKQGRFWRPWPNEGLPGGAAGAVLKAGFAAYVLPLVGLAVWGGVTLWRDACGHDGVPRP